LRPGSGPITVSVAFIPLKAAPCEGRQRLQITPRGFPKLSPRASTLARFRTFPHEVPIAGLRKRKPRVLLAQRKPHKARCAREGALRLSPTRGPIARHPPDFERCDLAIARAFRALIMQTYPLLSFICVCYRVCACQAARDAAFAKCGAHREPRRLDFPRSRRTRTHQTRLQERSFVFVLHVCIRWPRVRSCYASQTHFAIRGCG
jgi:hypothetical protein